jgi:cysteine desulfurase
VRTAAAELGVAGWRVVELPLLPSGAVDARDLAAEPASAAAKIVSVTTVCGQTGIRDDAALASSLTAAGWLVHADATQAAAWEEIAFAGSPWATLALAPHKFGGPRGIGGLLVRSGVSLAAVSPGPQELGLRGGTEAVQLAAGFASALELAAKDQLAAATRVAADRARRELRLVEAAQAAGLDVLVVGTPMTRAPHVTLLAVAGVDRQAVAMAADLAGVCLATGTACASGSTEPPAILAALGLPPRFQAGGIRLSLSRSTTSDDIDQAAIRLQDVFNRLGRRRQT